MSKEELKLLSKIAFMYYFDNLSQQEIANLLGISRSKVSRLLLSAREKEIVQINIAAPVMRCTDMEQELKKLYQLEEAIVVPVYSVNEDNILDSLGKAGADFILDHIYDGCRLGFSTGETLKRVANHLESSAIYPSCEIVPIMGGIWRENASEIDANTLSQRVAEKLGAKFYSLYSPAFISDEQLRRLIVKEFHIRKVLEKILQTDITFISVGSELPNYLTEKDKQQALEKNVVGDVAGWLYDREGKIVDLSIHSKLISPNIQQISQTSKIVLISGTKKKWEAIFSALKGNWVHSLITDEQVAELLIKEKRG